jgi:pimeloyl-ACP methyl ester carboxylesterase
VIAGQPPALREQTRARYPDASGFVVREGVRLFYEVYGEGDPPILFMPTWAIIHSRTWKAQIPYFARRHRVVTFDPRGNGRSDRPSADGAYDERAYAGDAEAVLAATGTRGAVVVSLSIGAQRSLVLAAEHPELVAGLCFIAPALPFGGPRPGAAVTYPFDEELDTDEGWAKYNRHYWLRDYQGFLEFFFGRCFTESHSTKQVEDCVGWGLQTDAETLIRSQLDRTLTRADVVALCARIRCPVTVIHGDDDAVRSYAHGRELAGLLGGALVSLGGSGHCPDASDSVAVNLIVRDFIAALPEHRR